MIDAALLLDKPAGISSNGALQQAKRLFGAAKAGTQHARYPSLGPAGSAVRRGHSSAATARRRQGVLATLKLGEKTSTGDAEGAVLERSDFLVEENRILPTLERFRGEIEQVPPMYSALKRDGVPLYELARKGKTVERAVRRVQIRELERMAFHPPYLELRVRCSKGTYVRTLAEDIGQALGTCAHLAALRRTASGRWRVSDAVALEALSRMPASQQAQHLLSLPALLGHLPRAELDGPQEARFRNGQSLKTSIGQGICAVYSAQGAVIGLGRPIPRALRPWVVAKRLINIQNL